MSTAAPSVSSPDETDAPCLTSESTSETPPVAEPSRPSWDRIPARVSLWAFFVLATTLRFPALFHNPSFYSEEGNVYFAYATDHGVVESIFATHVGYLSLFANVSGVAAAAVPLEQAAIVARVLGLVGPALCAWVIIEAPERRLARAAALGVLVFTTTMAGEWATTIHTQFWLAVALVVIVAVEPRSRASEVGQYAVAVLAGLTGALATLAVPAFLLLAIRERRRRDIVISGILVTSLMIQLAVGRSRQPSWEAGEFVVISFTKLVFQPLSGDIGDRFSVAWYEDWASITTAAIFSVLLVAWVGFVLWSAKGRWRLAAATSLWIGFVALYYALGPYAAFAFWNLGGRYAVAGVVPVLIALAMSFDRQPPPVRAIVTIVIALAVVRGVDSGIELTVAHNQRLDSWGESVAAFADDPGVSLPIGTGCFVSANGPDQRVGFDVEVTKRAADDDTRFVVMPGQYDTGIPLRIFVFSLGTFEVLTPDGWQPMDGYLYGDEGRPCLQSTQPVPQYDDTIDTYRGVLQSADLRDLAQRSRSVFIGYGRDFGDSFAKRTYVAVELCEVDPELC